ncbi:hypothetical protein KPL71_017574 [Citrus sinensis]|uniref:Uncharacterized protein n=1 Tax=Citrus sinensis TaxID=2711 RepID=A0ACB8JQG0_CITSI|nr:hypothetical protein KPL71_017574 [Citrus sinensis]
MATLNDSTFREGQSTTRPPFFDGNDYAYWKTRMRIYLQALDYEIWEVVCDGPFMPMFKDEVGDDIPKPSSQWSELEKRKMSLNSKAMNALFCALDKKEFHRVSSCESAQEIWNKLEVVYEGTNQVKESKISRYTRQYELFQMEQNENVYSMYTRFTDIVTTLGALGKTFSNKDLAAEKRHEEKKKSIALKASKYESDGESEPDDEELAMLARRSECPLINKFKKKAMVATWDDSEEESSDEEGSQEVSNLALMAIGGDDDLNEVSDPTYDEMYDAFKDLHNELMKIGKKNGLKKKKNKWYLDNGCSRHMTGNYAWFLSCTKIQNGGDVSFGDNSKGKILGIGNVDGDLQEESSKEIQENAPQENQEDRQEEQTNTELEQQEAVQTAQEDLPIIWFNYEGYHVYPAKHNGHFLWDAPGSGKCDPTCPCWDDWDEDDDYATTRQKKPKKKTPPVSCHHYDPKPPQNPPPPPAPLPFYQKELKWIAKHCKSETPSPIPLPTPPLTCMMFSSTSSDYSSSFPPLDTHTDSQRNVVSKPFVPSPITSSGHLEPPKPFESVLNCLRTEQLETKVDSISVQMQQIHKNLQSRITQLDYELRAMLAQRYYGPEFDQHEREIRRLKAELDQIESEKQRPTLFTTSPLIPFIGPTYHLFASMLSPIRQYDPSKLFGMTHTLFRDNPLPPPPKSNLKPKHQPLPVTFHPSSITIPGQHSTGHTPASPPVPPPPTESQPPSQSKDKQLMHQFSAHTADHSSPTADQTSDSILAVSDSHTETDTESSVSTKPYVDIPSEVEEEMPESSTTNQPPPTQAQTSPPSQKSSNGPWFTFDELPSHKWRDRLNEMSAWIDLQMLRPRATTPSVLREFATRFTGALRDWFDSLGNYRQLQFVQLPDVSSAFLLLSMINSLEPSAVFEVARRDYLNMKCCSLNAKDLDFHYKWMSLLFYKLNGFNEPIIKHVFLASLPDELQPDIQRQLTASNLSLDNISLDKIFQLAKTCLDKLCEQKRFFKELLKDKEPFRSACKKPYLQIKCKKKKDYDCSPKKKRHFKKFRNPEFSSRPRRSRKPYRFFRKKSSYSRDFKRRKSSRCFICKKKGHYAKDCPNKREKSIRLVEHLQATTDYSPEKDELEFYFSEQDEPNDDTVFALQNSSDDSDSDQS